MPANCIALSTRNCIPCLGASSTASTAIERNAKLEDVELRRTALRALLGGIDELTRIKSPFRRGYGLNIRLGHSGFINYGCVFLDCNSIRIGDDVQIGPGV